MSHNLSEHTFQITFEDGSVWEAKVEEIARELAEQYVDWEGGADTTVEDEFSYLMNDRLELLDRIGGWMDWEEIEPLLEQVEPAGIDYAEAFPNAEKDLQSQH